MILEPSRKGRGGRMIERETGSERVPDLCTIDRNIKESYDSLGSHYRT